MLAYYSIVLLPADVASVTVADDDASRHLSISADSPNNISSNLLSEYRTSVLQSGGGGGGMRTAEAALSTAAVSNEAAATSHRTAVGASRSSDDSNYYGNYE